MMNKKFYTFAIVSFLLGCTQKESDIQIIPAPWLDKLRKEDVEAIFTRPSTDSEATQTPQQISNFIVKADIFQNEKEMCKYIESWANQHLSDQKSLQKSYRFFYDNANIQPDNPQLEAEYLYLMDNNILCNMDKNFICYSCNPRT